MRDINYIANLETSMENDTVENDDIIGESMTQNLNNLIQTSLSDITTNTNESFTVEGMFCDSPNDEQLMKFAKYTMGVSLIGSILYVGSKVFLNKD